MKQQRGGVVFKTRKACKLRSLWLNLAIYKQISSRIFYFFVDYLKKLFMSDNIVINKKRGIL